MDIVGNFDCSLYCLGKLCKHGHDYGNGQSLRKKSSRSGVECRKLYNEARRQPPSVRALSASLGDKYYLGRRCKYGHDSGNGQSRSALSTSCCVKCNTLHSQQLSRNYKQYAKQVIERQRKYAETERGKEARRRASIKSRIKRSKQITQVPIVPFTTAEIMQRFEEFDNACAYCGSQKKLSKDHFIPISRGGADSLENIVPCCLSCNSSLKSNSALFWFQQQVFYREERWAKILRILGKSDDDYHQLSLF